KPAQNKVIYHLYRTNGEIKFYHYIGDHYENAIATFLLYYLCSHDHIRDDYITWKLSSSEVNELFIDGWNEYYSVDSYEIIQFEKKYPQYRTYLRNLPENIDKISNDLQLHDKWVSLIGDLLSDQELCNRKDLSIEDLLRLF
ncbi:MAG: hypothetical protein ACI4U3_08870, partial [Traorella sp.]